MCRPLSVLPLHLACQLLVSENSSFIDVGVDAQLPKLATELPAGYTVVPEMGIAYRLYTNPLTWMMARKYCAALDGYLAVIDSFEKLEFIMSINKPKVHLQVGIHRLFDDNEWTDLQTGLPAKALPWRTESYQGDGRKCTAMNLDGGGIVAIGCTEAYPFVCEVPLFKD